MTGVQTCALPISIFLAFFTEFLQMFSARDSDLADVLLNCAGISVTILWLTRKRHPYKKIALCFISLVVFIILGKILYDLIKIEYAFHHYRASLPVIADFSNKIDLIRIQKLEDSEFQIVPHFSCNDNSSLQINFTVTKYPGILFHKVTKNVEVYDYIEYMVSNPENDTLTLINRFDLKTTQNETFRQYHQQSIYPGFNRCEIPLAPVISNIKSENVQFDKLYFFLKAPNQPHCLYIDNIRFK